MGCTCSSDSSDDSDDRSRRAARTTQRRAAANRTSAATGRRRSLDGRVQPTHQGLASDDGSDDAAEYQRRRRAREAELDPEAVEEQRRQEEADFMLAQMIFHEQLLFNEQRQERLDAAREAASRSPVVAGLTDADLEAVGRVMRFDLVPTKACVPFPSPTTQKAPSNVSSPLKPPIVHRSSDASMKSGSDSAPSSVFLAAEAMECPLCMDELTTGCELRALYCGHVFHRGCIDDWLKRKRVCPFCQQDVTAMAQPTIPTLPGRITSNAPRSPTDGAAEAAARADLDDAAAADDSPTIVQGAIVRDGDAGGPTVEGVVDSDAYLRVSTGGVPVPELVIGSMSTDLLTIPPLPRQQATPTGTHGSGGRASPGGQLGLDAGDSPLAARRTGSMEQFHSGEQHRASVASMTHVTLGAPQGNHSDSPVGDTVELDERTDAVE